MPPRANSPATLVPGGAGLDDLRFGAAGMGGLDHRGSPVTGHDDRCELGSAAWPAALPALIPGEGVTMQLAELARADERPHLDAGPDVGTVRS